MLKESEIVGILRSELVKTLGWESDEIQANRVQAWNYFFNRARGDEVAGSSPIQSSDVADMIESVLSNIGPILVNESLIQFEPSGEEDEQAAQMETDFVAYMVAGQNQGYVELLSAIKDSLLLRNGTIRVNVQVEETSRRYTVKDMPEFAIQEKVESSDEENNFSVVSLEETDLGWNVRWEETTTKRELTVASKDPANILYSANHPSPYLESCPFIAERCLLTQSELIKMGYSREKVEKLPSFDQDTKSDVVARTQDEGSTELATNDPAQRIIETFEIQCLIDEDEDGIAELRHIHLASSTILLDEEIDWIEYATGSPFFVPHRLYGLSIYDKVKAVQDSKTHGLRMWHDNTRKGNQVRVVYNPLTTEEGDVLNPRGNIRSRDPQGTQQLVTNDFGQSLKLFMDYQDQLRSERGGASLDLASAQMQLAARNVGDAGVDRQMSPKEQLAAAMTANLANTLIRQVYLLVHKTLRAQMPGELTAKLNGKWVKTDPSQWPERKSVKVMTGLSAGEKTQRLQALTQVIGKQGEIIQQGLGGQLADLGGLYNAVMDWNRAAGLPNPEQYWIDPDSEEAQAVAQQKAQAEQAQQQAAAQAQQQQQAFQEEVLAGGMMLDLYKHNTEYTYKYDSDRLDAEIKEAELMGTATLGLEMEQLRFESQAADLQRKGAEQAASQQ